MARPTKEEKAKREAIKELGLFVRDSEIYTYFEDEALNINATPSELSYHFCMECEKRTDNFIFDSSSFMGDSLSVNIKKLYLIDFNLGLYYETLYTFSELCFISKENYFSETFVHRKEVEKILNRKVSLDIGNDLISLESIVLDDFGIVSREFFNDKKDVLSQNTYYLSSEIFTEEERTKVKEYYRKVKHDCNSRYLTLITKDNKCEFNNIGLERNTYAELDLTKPIEELIEFVTKLKEDYDKDPNNISNFHRLIGLELQDHRCNTKTCEIYKHKNLKPLSGRLMDVLFVYDCKKAGLDNMYIMMEIDNYWSTTKDLPYKQITLNTIRKYYQFAIDYIDKKEYKNFIKGYTLSFD